MQIKNVEIVDRYNIIYTVEENQIDVYREVVEKIRKSELVRIYQKNSSVIKINSLTYLPFKNMIISIFDTGIYSLTIEFKNSLKNQTKLHVNIKGNMIVTINKYLGLVLMSFTGISFFINLFSSETNLMNLLFGMLLLILMALWSITLTYWNRNNIAKGFQEIVHILA